jgi:hypothetical protein
VPGDVVVLDDGAGRVEPAWPDGAAGRDEGAVRDEGALRDEAAVRDEGAAISKVRRGSYVSAWVMGCIDRMRQGRITRIVTIIYK